MRTTWLFLQAILSILTVSPVGAQTMAVLQGHVVDPSGAALPNASIVVRDAATGLTRMAPTDAEGRYHVAAIPTGPYQVTAQASGFRSERIESLTFEVGRTLVRDFQLAVASRSEAVVVSAELPLVDRTTSVVGHVVAGAIVNLVTRSGSDHFRGEAYEFFRVGTQTFAKISRTRLPTGEAGSSRQIQLVAKLSC